MGIENKEPSEEEFQLGEAPPPAQFTRFGVLFYGVMALVAVIWRMGLYDEHIFFASAEAREAGPRLVHDGLLGLICAAGLIGLSSWMTRKTEWGERLARDLARALGPLSLPESLLLAVASGLAEEMLFRGALQPRVGWLLASLLFGAMHYAPSRALLPWTGFALVAGLIFGALFELTGNLIAPVVAHTVINGVNLPRLVKEYGVDAPQGGS